jgi:hypothetical protein
VALTKVKQRASGASRFVYTATAGQTTFSGTDDNSQTLSYDIGFVDVYLNGVKMVNGTDVTVNNGTSVVFASGVALNDIVDINTFGTFDLASFDTSSITSGTLNIARIADGSITDAKLDNPTTQDERIQAYVSFNGTGTPAINDSYNVSSIGDNGTGAFTINFTTTLNTSTPAVSGSCSFADSTANDDGPVFSLDRRDGTSNPTASLVKIITQTVAGGAFDCAVINVMVVGN